MFQTTNSLSLWAFHLFTLRPIVRRVQRLVYRKLEERKTKSIPSTVIKNLIIMILRSNYFRFSNKYCRQVTGTAMGTAMTLNYTNVFMDNFEQIFLCDYFQETGL